MGAEAKDKDRDSRFVETRSATAVGATSAEDVLAKGLRQ